MRKIPLLLLCLALSCRAPRPSSAPEGSLNPWILEVLREYPIDGSYGYHWPKEGTWEGTTKDVHYDGRRLASGDADHRSFCCGLLFEVYVTALLRASNGSPIAGLTAPDLHEFRLRVFGDSKSGERRRLVQYAVESMNLGSRIDRWEEARPGDLVQFWRQNGSGHSAVFLNWVWKEGKIAGLTYWSTQGSTRGIGYRTEFIGADGITEDEVYLARAGWPLRR